MFAHLIQHAGVGLLLSAMAVHFVHQAGALLHLWPSLFALPLGFANEYTPTGSGAAGALVPDMWTKEFEPAVYEAQELAPLFKKLTKTGDTIHVRKLGPLARTAPGNSTALLNLTYSIGTDTEATASPQTSYVALALNFNFLARMDSDPTDAFRQSAEASVAEGIDVQCGILVDDLVSVVGGIGQNVSEATFLDALVILKNAAKRFAGPGMRAFAFHHNQLDDVIASTQNWAQWQITGQEGAPAVGELKNVYATKFIETGNVQSIGGLFHNPLFIPDMTFGIAYNQTPTVTTQERDLARLVICWADFAPITIWSDRGCDYNTQVAA